MNKRARLLATTAFGSPKPFMTPAPRTADRIAISRAFLGRQPRVLRFPETLEAFWVEGEPQDWRTFLEEADAELGGLDATIAKFKRKNGGLS